MRNYINQQGEMVALDGEHEFDLAFCGARISAWKRWYFRKNSSRKAVIQLRQKYEIGEFAQFTKQWLELTLNGKEEEKFRIRDEAYDVLSRDAPNEEYPTSNLVFTTLETFIPEKLLIKK